MGAKKVVIKLGGHAMDDGHLLKAFIEDVARLVKKDMQFVIVHGGGPYINVMLKRLNIESRFVNGLRVTDEKALETVEMVLCGSVNKRIVRILQKHGVDAVGLSGEDGMLLCAEVKDPALGRVGGIAACDPKVLHVLLSGGFLPVVAPLAMNGEGEALNVNADTAAGAIAGALKADYFALLSDVPGVVDAGGRLLPKLDAKEIVALRRKGVISGGMIPKVECCENALKAGCRNAIILDGRQKNSLGGFIENGEELGTLIV